MHTITARDLIKVLMQLPPDTEISSIGKGCAGDDYFLSINGIKCETILDVPLQYKSNE